METNIVIEISSPVLHMAKFWFWSYGPKCCWPIKLQNSLKCNISRKKWLTKCIFDRQINIEVFYKLILSIWVCIGRHALSTKNKKFLYFCNNSRKRWGMKLIFCLLIKAKVFYKLIVYITSGVGSQACLVYIYPKQQVYNIFAISWGKHEGWSWFVCW